MAENDMKQILAIIVASIALVGCRSSQTGEPITLDTFHETTIYAQLKDEPIPLPNENPYGNNSGQRESYIEGFRGGWDWAISGTLLRGTFVTPTDLPDAEHAAWSAGWELVLRPISSVRDFGILRSVHQGIASILSWPVVPYA